MYTRIILSRVYRHCSIRGEHLCRKISDLENIETHPCYNFLTRNTGLSRFFNNIAYWHFAHESPMQQIDHSDWNYTPTTRFMMYWHSFEICVLYDSIVSGRRLHTLALREFQFAWIFLHGKKVRKGLVWNAHIQPIEIRVFGLFLRVPLPFLSFEHYYCYTYAFACVCVCVCVCACLRVYVYVCMYARAYLILYCSAAHYILVLYYYIILYEGKTNVVGRSTRFTADRRLKDIIVNENFIYFDTGNYLYTVRESVTSYGFLCTRKKNVVCTRRQIQISRTRLILKQTDRLCSCARVCS